MSRTIYLVCYDVAHPVRLQRIHRLVQAYAVGGQKSFYECWLTQAELRSLQTTMEGIADLKEDRIHFFQLDPRMQPLLYGQAKRQSLQPFLIV
jgi:CRISPR-associated protein Cas2